MKTLSKTWYLEVVTSMHTETAKLVELRDLRKLHIVEFAIIVCVDLISKFSHFSHCSFVNNCIGMRNFNCFVALILLSHFYALSYLFYSFSYVYLVLETE